MKRRLRGFTLTELIVVVGLSIVILGVVIRMFLAGTRGNQSARRNGALHGALLIQENLARDIRRMGVPPGVEEPMRLTPRSIAFYQTEFEDGDPTIHLYPVVYYLQPSPEGNLHMVRETTRAGGEKFVSRFTDVVLSKMLFRSVPNPQGPGRFLVGSGVVISDDVHAEDSTRVASFPLVFLGEIRYPNYLGGRLAASAGMLVHGLLPDLDPDTGEPY